MSRWNRWRARARTLFHRRRVEREMDEELRFHLDEQMRENLAAGMSPAEARRRAHIAFGGLESIKEECRDTRRVPWLETLWQDLRYASRSLRKSPGLVLVSVLSFGLGIGLNTALFAALDTVFGHRPTMREPDRMVGLEPGNGPQLSYLDYRDLEESDTFAGTTALRIVGLDLRSGDRVDHVRALAVAANYFEILGCGTALGRPFDSEEAAFDNEPRLVILSHGFWRQRFASDPRVIGRPMVLNGEPFLIAGVLPESHRAITGFVSPPLYVPLSRLVLPSADDRSASSLTILARLLPDETLEQAQAAAATVLRSLERLEPERNEGLGKTVELFPAATLQFRGTPASFSFFFLLLGVLFGLVLLIAAANVAGLLLARGARRRREMAIHRAVGAGRWRLLQVLLAESLLLSLLGGLTGLGVAVAAGGLRLPRSDAAVASVSSLTPSVSVLLFALALVLVTTVLAGLVPALRATRSDVPAAIRTSATVSAEKTWLRSALVVGQIALSLTLLVVAALCLRSQALIGGLDLGFDLEGGIVVRPLLSAELDGAAARQRLADQVLERVAGLPGVVSASVADLVPLGGDSLVKSFHPAGRTDIPGTRPATYSVGPRYFETLGIELLRGRELEASDDETSPPVVVVNETFARTYFPDKDPIGQRMQTADEADAEIVGLVADSRIGTIGESPKSVLYYSYDQRPRGPLVLHLRTAGAPAPLVATVKRALGELDGVIGITVETRSEAASLEMTMRRRATEIMATIGGVGLLLTLIGLYGVMAFVVATRTAEVGLRMALGASPRRVLWEVLRQALVLVAVGSAMGSLAALFLAPGLATFLAGISPIDPIAYGATVLLLVATALAATWFPARRATRVSPLVALRHP